MDFTRELIYNLNCVCNLAESAEYECAMQEAVLIETGCYSKERIIAIQEGLLEKAKEAFNKFPEIINSIYQKFEGLFNKKYTQNKEYIESKMEFINKEIKNPDIQIYKYNVDKIKKSEDLHLNYEVLKEDLDNVLNLQKKLFPDYATESEGEFVENIKKVLRGNPESEKPTIKLDKNILDGYVSYVKDFVKVKQDLGRDRKNILSTINAFKAIIQSHQNEANKEVKNESYHSYLFDRTIIHEEESTENKDNAPQKTDNTPSEKDKAASNIIKSAGSAVKNGASNLATAFKRTKNGIMVISKFFSAKMTIANECYNEYMAVIKNHIASHEAGAVTLTSEEEERVKNILNKYLDEKGNAKQLDDSAKSKLLKELKGALKGKESNAINTYNSYLRKIAK